MECWRAVEDSAFPTDLKLQFIGQTLMSHYIENNIDPFTTQGGSNFSGRQTISAFQPYCGRSRTPPFCKHSQSPYGNRC